MSLVDIYENEIKPRIDYAKELADLEPVKKGEERYGRIYRQSARKAL